MGTRSFFQGKRVCLGSSFHWRQHWSSKGMNSTGSVISSRGRTKMVTQNSAPERRYSHHLSFSQVRTNTAKNSIMVKQKKVSVSRRLA